MLPPERAATPLQTRARSPEHRSQENPGGHTCAVRHPFASGVNSLLALLLGGLELTVFTARTVPVAAENRQDGSSQMSAPRHTPRPCHGVLKVAGKACGWSPSPACSPPPSAGHLHTLCALRTVVPGGSSAE